MKLRIWCDSGANAHSKLEEILSLEELGFTQEEWNAMSAEAREVVCKEIAFAKLDWGFQEIP